MGVGKVLHMDVLVEALDPEGLPRLGSSCWDYCEEYLPQDVVVPSVETI